MMNTSTKFGISMRQSIIAFIIMIILIVIASNFSGQINNAQANMPNGIGFVLAAPPDSTLTATPFQPLRPTPTPYVILSANRADFSAFIPVVARSHQSEELIQDSIPPTIMDQEPLPPTATIQEAVPPTAIVLEAIPPTPIVVEVQPPTPEPQEPTPASESTDEIQFTPRESDFTDDEGRTWEDYPGPSVWPDITVPGPTGILSHPEDQMNILLLGSDQRAGDTGFRTDTIQLLTVNPSEGTVKLTSFPRDLYVYIPGYTVQRINTAYGWGGFEALADTMEYNFGVRPSHYVLINFSSFSEVIDSLGGIMVEVGRDLCDHRDDFGEFCVSQSTYWMDSQTALWYVRSRYTTSDLDRGRRQQEVLEAIFNSLISKNGLKRAPELYNIYKENVTTNLSFEILSSFIPIAAHIAKTHEIYNYSIGAEQVYNWINYSGAMVLVPIREYVTEVMRQVISEP